MSFVEAFRELPLPSLLRQAQGAGTAAVRASLARSSLTLADFAALLSPAADDALEEMGRRSRALTQQRFGRVVRLFAPLYLSNECVNNCQYCGFSRDNAIARVTLSLPEVVREAQALRDQGFRSLLLVAGEHPRYVSNAYLADSVRALRPLFPSLSLEVGPLDVAGYRAVVEAGAEGLVVYQETYDRRAYLELHTAGPKRDFDHRLTTPERAYAAGFRRLGIGALYGLADWRTEALAVAAHAAFLLRHCWKASVTLSVPRLRPCAGAFQPRTHLADRELARLLCAFRLFLPDVGLVLSTREPAWLRDGLIPLGITLMSAGSHTEPGGYTGAGQDHIHYSARGRLVTPAPGTDTSTPRATHQFQIADERSAAEVSRLLRRLGYEPVWKDWDEALSA